MVMAVCITPLVIRDKMNTNKSQAVRCGKCAPCRTARIAGWAFRCEREMLKSTSALFVTLTYAPENLRGSKSGLMNLDKTDVQKFFKRLRKYADTKNCSCEHCSRHKSRRRPVRYYAVGEYGGKSNRPHYHLLIFNSCRSAIEAGWSLNGLLIGQIDVGLVSAASIRYCLKYISKVGRAGWHDGDDRQPEFSLMSKGLGGNYLTKSVIEWHNKDPMNRMYLPDLDNLKVPMPRYYRDKIFPKWVIRRVGSLMQAKVDAEVLANKITDKDIREKCIADMYKQNQLLIKSSKLCKL